MSKEEGRSGGPPDHVSAATGCYCESPSSASTAASMHIAGRRQEHHRSENDDWEPIDPDTHIDEVLPHLTPEPLQLGISLPPPHRPEARARYALRPTAHIHVERDTLDARGPMQIGPLLRAEPEEQDRLHSEPRDRERERE